MKKTFTSPMFWAVYYKNIPKRADIFVVTDYTLHIWVAFAYYICWWRALWLNS